MTRKAFLLILIGVVCTSCVIIKIPDNSYLKEYEKFELPNTIEKKYSYNISSPLDLEYWLKKELKYIKDPNGKWKLPWETIEDGGGDCEDFAILNSLILYKLGYTNHILGMYNKKEGHAICVFKEKDGTWSYFDNEDYIPAKEKSISDLIKKHHIKWNIITFVKPNTVIYKVLTIK